MINNKTLALFGGKAIRKKPFTERFLFNYKEKKIINKLLDFSIKTGKQIRSSGEYEKKYQKKFNNFMGPKFIVIVLIQVQMLYFAV